MRKNKRRGLRFRNSDPYSRPCWVSSEELSPTRPEFAGSEERDRQGREADELGSKEVRLLRDLDGIITLAGGESDHWEFGDLDRYFNVKDVCSGSSTLRCLSFKVTRIIHLPVGSLSSPTYFITGAARRIL